MKIIDCEQRSEQWFAAREACVITASEAGPWLVEEPEIRLTIDEIRFLMGDDALPKAKPKADHLEAMANIDRIFVAKEYTALTRQARDAKINRFLGSLTGIPKDEFEILSEEADARKMDYNQDVQRGIAYEPFARAKYEAETGMTVSEVGMITTDCGMFGASPDGVIQEPSIVVDGEMTYDLTHGLEIKCPRREKLIGWMRAGVLPAEHADQVHFSMAVSGFDHWDFVGFYPGFPLFGLSVFRDDYTERMVAGMERLKAELETAKSELTKLWK